MANEVQIIVSAKDMATQVINQISSELNKASNAMENFANSASRMSLKASLAFTGITVAARKGLLGVASDAEQMNNVIEQSFGHLADEINQWADKVSRPMQRSRFVMREFAGYYQAMLKPLIGDLELAAEMSKELSVLTVDLASFWNVADEEVFTALRSGLAGQTMPLRRFGIEMNQAAIQAFALEQGINKSVRAMTEAEKVQLRYNYILAMTVDQQGDAERTAHEYANALVGLRSEIRNVSEDYGNYLLPFGEEMVALLRDGVLWMGNLDEEIKAQIVRWGVFGTALLGGVAAFGLVAKAAGVLAKGLTLVSAAVTIATSPITLKLALLTTGVALLAGAWESDFARMKSTVESFGGGVSGVLDSIKSKIEKWWHGESPTGWGDFLLAQSGVDTRRGGFKDKLEEIKNLIKLPKFEWPKLPKFEWPKLPKFEWPELPKFEWPELPKFEWPELPKFKWPELPKFKWPTLPNFEWPKIPEINWPKLSVPQTVLNGINIIKTALSSIAQAARDLADIEWSELLPDLAKIFGESFATTPVGQGTKTVKESIEAYFEGEKPLGEAIKDALLSELNVPLAGFALTMMASGKLRLTLGIGTVVLSLLPEATTEGFKETLGNIWQSIKNTWFSLTGQLQAPLAELTGILGIDEMVAAIKRAEGVHPSRFLKSFVAAGNSFASAETQRYFEELLERTGAEYGSDEYWDMAVTASVWGYWRTFKNKFGLAADTTIADLSDDMRKLWVEHIGSRFAPTVGVGEWEASQNKNWIPNVTKILEENLAEHKIKGVSLPWTIDLSNFEFNPNVNELSGKIGSSLGKFFGSLTGQLIKVAGELGKSFAKDILKPFSVGFAEEFKEALGEQLEGVSLADILTGGLTIGVGLTLVAGAGKAILGAIGAIFGNAAGLLGLGGIATAIGLLTVGIELKEAVEQGTFEEFGAKLVTAIAAGMGVGFLTGNPAAGILTTTLVLQLDWEWLSPPDAEIKNLIPDDDWLQNALMEYRSLWYQELPWYKKANPLAGLWAPSIHDEDFIDWALEKWYTEKYGDPKTRKYQRGVILPGYGGGDIIPALLEPGEAVIPKEVVFGGPSAMAEWLKKMGAPGFQHGLLPDLPDIPGLGGANIIIDDMSSMFSELGKTVITGFNTMFDTIFDIVESAAVSLFGEERVAAIKDTFDKGRERLQQIVDSLYPERRPKEERPGWGDFLLAQQGISSEVNLRPLWLDRLIWWHEDYAAVNLAHTEIVADMVKLTSRFNTEAGRTINRLQSIFDVIGTIPEMSVQIYDGFVGIREQISQLFDGGVRGEFLGRLGAGLAGWQAFSQGTSGTNILGGIAGALAGFGIGGKLTAGLAIGAQIISSLFPGTAGPSSAAQSDKAFRAQDEQLKKQIDEYNKILSEWGATTQVENLTFKKDAGFLGWRYLFGNVKWETIGRDAAEAGAELAQRLISSMESVFNSASQALFNTLFRGSDYEDFGRVIGQEVQQALFKEIIATEAIEKRLKNLSAYIAEAVQGGLTTEEIEAILNQSSELYNSMEPFREIAEEIAKQFGLAEESAKGLTGTMRNAPVGFKIDLSRWHAAQGVVPVTNSSVSENNFVSRLAQLPSHLQRVAASLIGARPDITIELHGPFNGIDDLKSAAREAALEALDAYYNEYQLRVFGTEGV